MWSLLTLALAAGSSALPKIAVMDVTVRAGVPANVGTVLSDALVAEVRKRRQRSQVISAEEIRAMLQVTSERQKLGCAADKDIACIAEIGGALGAEQMVIGTLGKLGKTYVFGLKVVDVGKAKVLQSASVNIATQEDDELLNAAAKLVALIFPDLQLAPGAPPAALETTQSTGPSSHSHLPAILIGVGGLVAGGVAAFGFSQIFPYNNDVGIVNSNGTVNGVPLSQNKLSSDKNAAQIGQVLGFACGVVAVAGLATAVILW